MELIEKYGFPVFKESFPGVCKARFLVCYCRKGFDIVVQALAFAVVFLTPCLTCESTSVEFKVEFTAPGRKPLVIGNGFVKIFEEIQGT